MIGRSISHYEITEKIGEGGMGHVFRARDTKLKRDVALKFLPQSMAQDETARRRFLREARSAAALDHPYICQIFEIGEVDGVGFIVMEYVSGQTLKEKLAEERLPVPECLRIAAEIAEALDKAQQTGIVHRDLKPANIMITSDGHVKLMDFGLAKRASGAQEVTQQVSVTKLTRAGSTLGTVPYMSPEQLQGREVDHRSDLFSLGVVLHEMATGRLPFSGESSVDQMAAIMEHLDELVETGFRGPESDLVVVMIGELNRIETDTDQKGMAVLRQLFAHENEIDPVSLMIWHRLIHWVGDLANYSEKVGNRLRLLVAH